MKILKFGGTSLADAQCILNVSNIIKENLKESHLGIVLSAVSGATNLLVKSIDQAINTQSFQAETNFFEKLHRDIVKDLNLSCESLNHLLKDTCEKLVRFLQGVQLLKVCPDQIYSQILSLGERLSAKIVLEVLILSKIDVTFLDAAEFIKTRGSLTEATPDLEILLHRFDKVKSKKCLLMSGFIGSDVDGNLSLLGRDGSDYSASLMAFGLGAEACEIWTNVDGIYTADPSVVRDAQLISEMSYGEAMELAFYGAKILHPKTTSILKSAKIPLSIKNSFNPKGQGTKITETPKDDNKSLIRAVSCRSNVVLINIYGGGMKGASGIAAHIFDIVAKSGTSVILISQASSECSICFCVSKKESEQAVKALYEGLALELKTKIVENIIALDNQSIICVVGKNMKERFGVAGKFFSALSHSAINIVAIAQGSSEQCISVVIDEKDGNRAVHAVHRSFFHALQPIELYLIGVGSVGSELVEQIKQQQKELLENKVEVKLCLIANSKKYLHDSKGLQLDDFKNSLSTSDKAADIDAILKQAMIDKPLNGIFVDCTSSDAIANRYVDAFNSGLHVVTANKKANSDRFEYYQKIRLEADRRKRLFLYETNVGAGLPTIDAFKYLIKSGDTLVDFSGILSGSLSFIFGALDEGMSFSEAVVLARNKKFTEPDPRDDLSGMDVARKVLILARETRMSCELEDIQIKSIFPEDFDSSGSVDDFLVRLTKVDGYFKEEIAKLGRNKKVLRYVGEINNGRCYVGLRAVGLDHPLYAIKNGENAFAFLTKRYSPIPLVVRGYGAGVEVTASGLFSDILKTVDIN